MRLQTIMGISIKVVVIRRVMGRYGFMLINARAQIKFALMVLNTMVRSGSLKSVSIAEVKVRMQVQPLVSLNSRIHLSPKQALMILLKCTLSLKRG